MPENLTLTELELTSDEVKGGPRLAFERCTDAVGRRAPEQVKSSQGQGQGRGREHDLHPQYTQKLRIVGVGLENDDIADYIENLRVRAARQCRVKFIKESKIDGVLLRSFEWAMIRPVRTHAVW